MKITNDKAMQTVLDEGQSEIPQDPTKVLRQGLFILIFGVGGFFLWASLAPLDQGVPVSGFVKVQGSSKEVKHLSGGIIESIMVKEGQSVEKGQPLLALNETQLKAKHAVVESQLISLLAVEARLLAEREDKVFVEYPAFLEERSDEKAVREAIQVQDQLFKSRKQSYLNEISIAEENIAGLLVQIEGLEGQQKARDKQLRIFNTELKELRPLFKQGYIPRTRIFELERTIASLTGQRSQDISTIGLANSKISETKLQILQATELRIKEIETQLTDVQRQVLDLKERLVASKDDLERVVIRSPARGVVYGLNVSTVGSVIAPREKIMDILPEGTSLLIEVEIPTQLIDNVHVGLNADINFAALDRFEISRVEGELTYVSANRLEEERSEETYYKGRVRITEAGMAALEGHVIQPGMPASVVIVTGERTMLSYLVKPLVSRLQFAFTER